MQNHSDIHRRPRRTWFMIADGAKARLYESFGPQGGFTLLDQWQDDEARLPNHDLADDKPIRNRSDASGRRFSHDISSEHEQREEAFIRDRANFLNLAASNDEYEQLVLAAPARSLGLFRKILTDTVSGKSLATFSKDLTNVPEQAIAAYFTEHLTQW